MALKIAAIVTLEAGGYAPGHALTHPRCRRADIDRTGQGVLSKQDALGAAQDFYLLQIKQAKTRLAALAVVDTVHEDTHRLLEGLLGTHGDAPHGDNGVHRVFGHRKVRHIGAEVAEASDRGILNEFAADRGHGNRNVLKALGSFLSRNNDFLKFCGQGTGRCGRYGDSESGLQKSVTHGIDPQN